MSYRATAFAVVAAALLLTGAAGVGLAAPTATAADARTSALAAGESAAADLTGVIERIDAILESVLDLLRTLNQLFGLGGEGEGAGGEAGD